jgi:hypothetical protein
MHRHLWTVLPAMLTACAAAGPAPEFDRFTLASGEARRVEIGANYVDLRLCNDLASRAAVLAIIEPRQPQLLQPGECTEDRGGGIAFQNRGSGPADVSYRRIFGSDIFGNS